MAGASAKTTPVVERCWTLVGRCRGRIWLGRCLRGTVGERACVAFDGQWVLEREEKKEDVIGFFHTHPDGPSGPSGRDVRTMQAWCSAFGKPLLCLIESPAGLKGYRFEADREEVELSAVEKFPRGIMIGVEAHGR